MIINRLEGSSPKAVRTVLIMNTMRKTLCDLVEDGLRFLHDAQNAMKGRIALKKGLGDISTPADIESQERLIAKLKKLFPGVSIVAEEAGSQELKDNSFFLVDPLDGSTNFFRGHSHFANSLVWIEDGEPAMAASAVGERREIFSACRGEGAYLNETKIETNHERLNDMSIVAMHSWRQGGDAFWKWLRSYQGKVRNYGSVISHICQVACNRIDLCVFPNIKLWDFAGPGLILTEAGGFISSLSGRPLFPMELGKQIDSHQTYGILASNGAAHLDLDI